jgi:hypothetical protein
MILTMYALLVADLISVPGVFLREGARILETRTCNERSHVLVLCQTSLTNHLERYGSGYHESTNPRRKNTHVGEVQCTLT